ncbi:hypothetical protein [Sphingomonas dokdonensis]|uniref:Uncharacterized protein n=1 Tax=Sphingomonas dokdonensis TaxID=344880 RepID=A0A245ZHK9_9SPHN|nr:hypothetical protein [Sphingomonas dokdonensis]OWK29223.1 hypothetical protein SPDO_22040 [Sphingomonas dokdonensis]
MRLNARLILKLIIAVPALIDLGRRGAAAGRAIVDLVAQPKEPR